MDYECDYGYSRPLGSSGACTLDMEPAQWTKSVEKRQKESCDEYGYYEVSSGYRKIPGNICTGGV